MKHYLKSVLLLLLLATTTVACMQEIDTEGVSGNNDPEVTFTFELPAQAKPTTRATVGENTIENVYVLAFDKDNKFSYYRPITTIEDVDSSGAKPKKKFKVSLIKSTDANDKYSFVLIANVKGETKTQIEALSKTTAMADVLAGLTYTTDENVVPAIPMASLPTAATEINNTTTFTEIALTRMAARIDVLLSATDYRIAEVHLYDYNTRGWVCAPEDAFKKAGVSQDHVQVSTIGTNREHVTGSTTPISVLVAEADRGNEFSNQLYTFEAKNTDNNPCIVVKLEKKTSTDTWESWGYYKAVFEQDATKLDILRNYRYLFNISNVYNKGFENKEGAYESIVSGMNVDVIDWNEVTLPIVGTDGTYILAVNQMMFMFPKEAIIANELTNLLKVYTTHTAGWAATSDKEWLTLSLSEGNVVGQTESVYMHLDANDTEASRTATIKVTAGKIAINITVTQTTKAGDGGNDTPYTLTATNSSKYMRSRTHNFTLTSTGDWKITEFSNLASGTTIKIDGKDVATGLTGTGSATPATVAVVAGATAGTVSITFVCTNGYFTNGDKENGYKVTISFEIVSEIYYDTHNGWAGSNVYWDEENQRPTFDVDPGENNVNSFKQGIFFKWGSLVGLAPCGRTTVTNINWNGNQYTVYYNTSPTSYTVYNTSGNDFTNYGTWENIPYVSIGERTEKNRHWLLEVHDPENHIGDICKLISDNGWVEGQWRMPTMVEFGTIYELVNYNYVFKTIDYTGVVSGTNGALNVNGTGMIGTYQTKKASTNPEKAVTIFPASGMRHYSGGVLAPEGKPGHYWSGTSDVGEFAYGGWFYLDPGALFAHHLMRDNGHPVRCVRE